LLYALVFHFSAGIVTGSVFKVRTLLALTCFAAVELTCAALMRSGPLTLAAGGSLVAVQMGYFAGLFTRTTIERSLGRAPAARTHRVP
jgi:hypothetical protein